jgi:hypothetical protein
MTDFPHAHMGVLHFAPGAREGVTVDPFTGAPLAEGCGLPARPLWAEPQAYEPGALYAAGFADHVPGRDIKENAATAATLPPGAPALVVWGAMFGAARGDIMRVKITAPDGAVLLEQAQTVEGDQAWRVHGMGKKRPQGGWAAGRYLGTFVMERAGRPPQVRHVAVEVAP